MRRIVRANSYAQAVEAAREFNKAILGDKGYIPSIRGVGGHLIAEALREAIKIRRARPETRQHYVARANLFLAWLEDMYPGIRNWGDLRPLHVQTYLNSLEAAQLAWNAIRLRFVPLRMASIHMSDNYPERYRHITRKVKLPPPDRRQEKGALAQGDLLTFSQFVEERRPDLMPLVLLQLSSGLRVRETLSIREKDIDWESGTIAITETSVHIPKNSYSDRVIPVPAVILRVLGQVLPTRKVVHPEGYVFMSRLLKPWTQNGYNHALQPLISQCARDKKIKALEDYTPRDFRSAFVTFVREQGADSRVVKAYIGQTPVDVLGRHYERITTARMRSEIVARVEKAEFVKTFSTYDRIARQHLAAANGRSRVVEVAG